MRVLCTTIHMNRGGSAEPPHSIARCRTGRGNKLPYLLETNLATNWKLTWPPTSYLDIPRPVASSMPPVGKACSNNAHQMMQKTEEYRPLDEIGGVPWLQRFTVPPHIWLRLIADRLHFLFCIPALRDGWHEECLSEWVASSRRSCVLLVGACGAADGAGGFHQGVLSHSRGVGTSIPM